MSGGEPVKTYRATSVKKANKAKKPKQEQYFTVERRLVEIICHHDIDWFINKTTVAGARAIVEAGTQSKISAAKFAAHVNHCKAEGALRFWKVAKRKGEAKHNLLTNEQWEKLRFTVFDMSMDLRGRSIAEGVVLISTRVRTNVVQLLGLPKRLHFWVDQSAQ